MIKTTTTTTTCELFSLPLEKGHKKILPRVRLHCRTVVIINFVVFDVVVYYVDIGIMLSLLLFYYRHYLRRFNLKKLK